MAQHNIPYPEIMHENHNVKLIYLDVHHKQGVENSGPLIATQDPSTLNAEDDSLKPEDNKANENSPNQEDGNACNPPEYSSCNPLTGDSAFSELACGNHGNIDNDINAKSMTPLSALAPVDNMGDNFCLPGSGVNTVPGYDHADQPGNHPTHAPDLYPSCLPSNILPDDGP